MECVRRIAARLAGQALQPGMDTTSIGRHADAAALTTNTGDVEAGRIHLSTWTMGGFVSTAQFRIATNVRDASGPNR
jgi:hypothetical protein